MRKLAISAAIAAVSALSFSVGSSPAGALVGPSGLVNAPAYCLAIYGSTDPCPPPERPDPVRCLRVDIAPLDCPYQP